MTENDEAPIRLHARPTKRDIVLAKLIWYFRTPVGWWFTGGGLVGPFVLFAMYSGMAGSPWERHNDFVLLVGPSVAVFLPLLVAFGGMNNAPMRAYLREGSRYAFTRERVEVAGPLASSSLDWRAFTKAHETAGAFILFSGVSLHLLPKKAFDGQPEVERLRALLKEKLGTKASLRTG